MPHAATRRPAHDDAAHAGSVDLLLSKLQIFELNEKDADECLRLLINFPVADDSDPDSLDLTPFASE